MGIGGVLFSLFAVLLALGAVNSGNNLLFLVFGVVIGSIIVSGVVSGSMLMGLRVRRRPPARLRVGEPGSIVYELENTARFSHAFALIIREPAPDAERLLGTPIGFVTHIPPRAATTLRVPVTPVARGVAVLDRVSVASRFPVGFLEKTITAHSRHSIIVHPRVAVLKRDPLAAITGRSLESSRQMPRAGRGDEFFGLREYSPGDALRQIAWRASARADTLVVRQNTERRSRTLWILLDDTADDEEAVILAASIAWSACDRGMSVGLSSATRGSLVAPGRGPRHRTTVLDALASVAYEPDAVAIPWRGAGRAACVVVHALRGSLRDAPPGAVHLEAGALGQLEREPASPEAEAAP